MNRDEALEYLEKIKNETGLSRDKMIEVYNIFRFDPSLEICGIPYKNELINVENNQAWQIVNTCDIKNMFKTDYSPKKNNEEIQLVNTILRKQSLKKQARLNYERKAFNKDLKKIGELEELNQEIISALKELPKKDIRLQNIDTIKDKIGVLLLSDLHANELIDIPSNKYDFEIMSKRLRKFCKIATKYFTDNGITDVILVGLGDMMNSDRRYSEKLNMATNRSKALVLTYYILKQFIEELSLNFNLTIKFQVGNESRIENEDFDTSDIIATYNYDFSLFQMLKIGLETNDNIKFIDGDWVESVLKINNSNVLFSHGTFISNDTEKTVAQTFGRYANNGVLLDYFFYGHKHSAKISDLSARSGSLCGGNSYSEGTLNLISRASQLMGIFYADKSHEIVKVDLQNTDDICGYNIVDKLEEYNIKSSDKKQKYMVHLV